MLEILFRYSKTVTDTIKHDNLNPEEIFRSDISLSDYCELHQFEVTWSDEETQDYPFTDTYCERSLAIVDIKHFENNENMFPLLRWIPRDALLSLAVCGGTSEDKIAAVLRFENQADKKVEVSLRALRAFIKFKGLEPEENLSADETFRYAESDFRRTSIHDGDNPTPLSKSMDQAVERINSLRSTMRPADMIAFKKTALNVEEHFALLRATRDFKFALDLLDIFYLHKDHLLNIVLTNSHIDMYGREDNRKVGPLVDRLVAPLIGRIVGTWLHYTSKDVIAITRFYINKNGEVRAVSDGREFEQGCLETLTQAGWKVNLTSVSGDYGGDLIAERDELRWCIQCKDTGKPAGVTAIQQAVAGTAYYGCDYAVVVSRSGFTNQASILASRLKVILTNENNLRNIHLFVD